MDSKFDANELNERLAKINTSRKMKIDMQLNILQMSMRLTQVELLQDKTDEYKTAWWSAWDFFVEFQKEQTAIIDRISAEYDKESDDAMLESIQKFSKVLDEVIAEINKN
jgi:hypothetical protein